jgi:hypothetical protein
MSIPARIAIVIGLALPGAAPHAAEAPRPAEGPDCRELARSTPETRAWWTTFFGERVKAIGDSDVREWTREVRCFTSEADCQSWLAWAETHWPDYTFWRACRRGFPAWLQGPDT